MSLIQTDCTGNCNQGRECDCGIAPDYRLTRWVFGACVSFWVIVAWFCWELGRGRLW